jgi:AI-2 transport protein TqsA
VTLAAHRLISQPIVVLAALVIVIGGLKFASDLVVPFLLALFIAIVSGPPMIWLNRRGLPMWLSLILVLAGVFLSILLIVSLMGGSVASFSQDLPKYDAILRERFSSFLTWIELKGIKLPTNDLLNAINPGTALQLVSGFMNGLGGILSDGLMIMLMAVFLLFEGSSLSNKIQYLEKYTGREFSEISKIMEDINQYLGIKTLTSLATGLLIGLWLYFLDVPYPLLWGTLAFLLNYIPTIGSIIAAVPTVIFAFIAVSPLTALWVAVAYLVVNSVIGNILEPLFMGARLGLSALVVLLSMIFWGWVFGPVGMFLSVPITMAFKIAMGASKETQWIAILMGSDAEQKEKSISEAEETA